jgi:osmotically-inducible protein OsmY
MLQVRAALFCPRFVVISRRTEAHRVILLDTNVSLIGSSEAIPDDDLRRRIVNYLISRQIPGARSLLVRAESGVVTLAGKVDTFYYKQLCTHSCLRVAGVLGLIDEIEVASKNGKERYQGS